MKRINSRAFFFGFVGQSDPYVVVELHMASGQTRRFRSSHKNSTKNPVWHYEHAEKITKSYNDVKTIVFHVYDWDYYGGHDLIGSTAPIVLQVCLNIFTKTHERNFRLWTLNAKLLFFENLRNFSTSEVTPKV